MKKTQFNKLSLNKKTISSFNVRNIKGGTGLTANTDEVSGCLPCLEDPTEGCPAQTEGNCPSYTCVTNNAFCNTGYLVCR